MPLLQPLDFLSLTISFWKMALPFHLVKAILSSWSQLKRLHLELDDFSSKKLCSSGFFADRFPLKEAVPAGLGLEEFRFSDSCWRSEIVPKAVISVTAWQCPDTLRNLKVLTIDAWVQLERNSFATLVRFTPNLERFSGFNEKKPGQGLAGLRPLDLMAVSGWTRLRFCHIPLDINEKDVAPSPTSRRQLVQLSDAALVPDLVRRWKETLLELEIIDVVCRFVVDGKYSYSEDKRPGHFFSSKDIRLFPLIFGSRCDAGKMHFQTDGVFETEKELSE